jgi:colanic acid/amylovoran biosynthesis glycosyltransferase
MIVFVSQKFPAVTETFTYDEARAVSVRSELLVASFRPGDPTGWPLRPPAVSTLPQSAVGYLRDLAYWLIRKPRTVVRVLAWASLGSFERRPTARERLGALIALGRGAHLARLPDVDLYHAQFANEAATAALVAAELAGRRFSFRSHTAPNPQLLRTKLAHAALVLSISEYDRALLERVAPAANVVVSRLGVDVPETDAETEEGLIVSVGSLIEKKGHHVLVAACAALVAAGRSVRCEIAGEGPARAGLERLIAEHGLDDVVMLRGALPRADTLELIARANVFVLASVPSASEGEDGIPVVLMEALARSRPSVATRLSGIPELVVDGETGLLVAPGDEVALASAIAALLDDPGRAKTFGAAGRAKVLAEYDATTGYARSAELLAAAASR